MNIKSLFKMALKGILYTVLVLIFLAICIMLFMTLHPTFGDEPNEDSLEKITRSDHYRDGKFHNLIPTSVMTSSDSDYSIMDFFLPPKEKNPQVPLPSEKLNAEKIKDGTFTWLGHASILMKTNGITILTDPVFDRASPIPVGGKPFALAHPLPLEDFPQIDAIVISHDHYDHLEYERIKAFASDVGQFFVPLGVKAHITKWGVPAEKIQEMDWYESTQYKGVDFTLVPTRHFSGRGITNGNSTLWGGWVVKSNTQNIFFSGDSGYFEEFKEIGKQYGPFDISFIDSGAYNKSWATIHMMPEESVQASLDLKSNVYFPIGWARFDLAPHFWDDPIIRATQAAKNHKVTIATPLIGQTFRLDALPQTRWWEALR